ncbi:anti-sigma factor [Tsukamurella asaccharolytica]|uniref:Regulator of SigK n=1 Tax=Tsukamurella asaccharolytica TaxID=2592067 RepID=A0A5C5REG7_9ACTN|nr:anti-sigma factor [Tsukamurella asaccharolytica]TWS21082.1 anti-sigma factor [Tsukamurella asaccharolytica]
MSETPNSTGSEDPLLDDAEVYALHALDADERASVEAARSAATAEVREDFDARVGTVRETMAAQAARYAVEPPAEIFDRVLGQVVDDPGVTPLRRRRSPAASRTALRAAAAAAVVVVAVAAGVVLGRSIFAGSDAPAPSEAEIVLAAPDARSAQTRVGDATISFIYSRERNAGVVLMNDVPPPQDGTVYQMWLMDPGGGARSRGTMSQADVRPTTTAAVTSIDGAATFGISIERPGGASTPSDRIVTTLPIAR